MLASPSQTPEGSSTAPQASIADRNHKITRGHSCVLCQQRKVKCDRQKPCANCVKARAECVVAPPSLPRRRRKRLTESDLVMRLRRYEHLLKSHGVKVEEEDLHPADYPLQPSRESEQIDLDDVRRLTLSVPKTSFSEPGALFFGKNNTHFAENTLWETMKEEIQEQLNLSSGEDSVESDLDDLSVIPPGEALLMGATSGNFDLSPYHPPVVQLFRLWQIFLDNVNPLVKMFHAPTVQQMMISSSGNLEGLSKPNEALMFSIYFLAIISIDNDNCLTNFGEPRQKLLVKYTRGIQQALANARLLRTMNITTLQAFVLYLIGGRSIYDMHTIWTLSGVAVRIAQRLGLHTDSGNSKLTPFDIEMRRRTWWQVVFLDGHASKLAGAPFPTWMAKFDAKLPANISDSEISPAMTELPASKEGVTEMIFCSVRYECLQVLRTAPTIQARNEDGTLRNPTLMELMESKDRAIQQVENLLNRKYVRYCDPSIPLQLLIIYMSKSVISNMKIMAHHPRNYEDKGASMPQPEKDIVFGECLYELELHSASHNNKVIQQFMWHVHVYFQLDAFIYMVSELRTRTTGELSDRAWEQVRLAYEHRPELLKDHKNPLFVAIGRLVLKAWASREQDNIAVQLGASATVYFKLRAHRGATHSKSNTESPQQDQTQSQPQQTEYGFQTESAPMAVGMLDQLNLWDHTYGSNPSGLSFDPPMPGVTASEWDYWKTLMEGDLVYAGNAGTGDWV